MVAAGTSARCSAGAFRPSRTEVNNNARLYRGSPCRPRPRGGPTRNEFVFGDSLPPPPGPARPAASGGGVGFHPSRAASTNVPAAFVLRGRRRRGRLLRPTTAAAAPRQAESYGNVVISRATYYIHIPIYTWAIHVLARIVPTFIV